MDRIFGGGPDFSLFNPIVSELAGVWGWVLAIGIVVIGGTFAFSAIALGTSRDNMGKAAGAIVGMKNSLYGIGALLVAFPLLVAIIVSLSKR